MFNCSVCAKSVGPKVSPVKIVTGIRPKEYHNEFHREDEFGARQLVKVDSAGSEITGEALVCPTCAQEPTYTSSHTIVGGRTFQEKLAAPIEVKLIASVVQSMLTRLEHKSQRAKQDTEVVVPNIKAFLDQPENAKFVF